MLINLWVRDNNSGEVHQIGTDTHDSIVFLNGEVVYENLQNGCGTLKGDGTYSFVEPPADEDDNYVSVTPEQLKLNRNMIHKDLLTQLQGIISFDKKNKINSQLQKAYEEAMKLI
jgi:hypothetical protein